MASRITPVPWIASLAMIAAASNVSAQNDARTPAGNLLVEAYAVADLVVPAPGGVCVLSLGEEIKMSARPGQTKPDFEDLMDEITSTIAPDSWKNNGGTGIIAENEATLSIVVRQTRAVHDQIAALIREKRQEIDTQICFEVRRVEVPERFLESIDGVPSHAGATLDEKAMKSFFAAVQSETRANLLSAPKVTLFQDQAIWIRESTDRGESSLVLNPKLSTDRRSIKLSLAATGRVDGEARILCETVRLKSGESLLLDRDGASKAGQRELLLITPRVIVADEEEKLLSLSAE